MHLPNKPVNELKLTDIDRLKEAGVPEDSFIDYKEELHLKPGDETKEFLFDITSFANHWGGEIIYGIKEERDEQGNSNGLIDEIKGIEVENKDKLKLKIEDKFRNGVDEKLAGISYDFIPVLGTNKYLLVFRIPMSLKAPHMVTYRATNKFYIRGNGNKALMDVREIKMAFDRTSGLKERAEKFITDRLEQVKLEVIANSPSGGGYIVGHFVPLNRDEYQLDITNQQVIERLRGICPPVLTDYNCKHTYEGFKTYAGDSTREDNYTLFFRDGSVEFYDERLIHNRADYGKSLHPIYEKYLIECFEQIRKFYEDNTFNLPFIYSLSLLKTKATKMVLGILHQSAVIKREDLLLPKLYVDDLSQDSATILKPLFDVVWNAFGEQRSLNYTEDGVYSPPN